MTLADVVRKQNPRGVFEKYIPVLIYYNISHPLHREFAQKISDTKRCSKRVGKRYVEYETGKLKYAARLSKSTGVIISRSGKFRCKQSS